MLFNKKAEGFLGKNNLESSKKSFELVTDIFDRLGGADEGYTVTASKVTNPCVRSIFLLKR